MKTKEYTIQFQHAETRSFDLGCSVEILAENKNQAIDRATDKVSSYFKKQKSRVVDIRKLDINDDDDIELLFHNDYFDVDDICSSKKECEILELKFEKLANKNRGKYE